MFCYLHVPFCASKCIYCDFYVTLIKYGGVDAYVSAVCREIDETFESIRRSEAIYNKPEVLLSPLETLYVGGGTPSLLSPNHYEPILQTLKSTWGFASNPEVTMEFNPNHVSSLLESYRELGFNRVSVGIQSFQENELKRLSRSHTAKEAQDFIKKLQQAGFDNISVDLMYGLPEQSAASWEETLKGVIDLGIQHVSMYGLKVETGTPLEKLLPYAAYHLPDDDTTVSMYEIGIQKLEAAGFVPYEFSNLAKPGYESRHNLNYWDNGPYLGMGPGAHGYLPPYRTENIRDLSRYSETENVPQERTFCSQEESLENALIFGLRKRVGVSIPVLERQYGFSFQTQFKDWLEKYQPNGWICWDENSGQLALSSKAIPVSNTILGDLLIR
jgi:oxygen-independent coproporphyrinogen III oxidase